MTISLIILSHSGDIIAIFDQACCFLCPPLHISETQYTYSQGQQVYFRRFHASVGDIVAFFDKTFRDMRSPPHLHMGETQYTFSQQVYFRRFHASVGDLTQVRRAPTFPSGAPCHLAAG